MRTYSALAVFAFSVLACSDDSGPAIDARVADGPTADARVIDAASPDAVEFDAATPDAADVDAAVPPDAAVTPDAAADPDAAVSPDAAVPPDAAVSPDAAVPPDAAVSPDAGSTLPGETCQLAEVITAPAVPGSTTVTATTAAYTSNYNPGCAGVNSTGPDRVHAITIPANTRLNAAVVPTAATFDPGIYLIAAPATNCDAAAITCLASNDNGGDGETDAITFDNATDAPRQVLILIDGFRAVGDAYTINLSLAAIPAALPGETCQTATTVTIPSGMTSTTVTATTAGYTNNYAGSPCTGFNANGPDRAHAFAIPAGQRLTATVTPTGTTFDPGIYVVAAPAATCDASPLVCLGGEDGGGDGEPDLVTIDNTGAAAQDVFIVIDTFRAAGDAYSLTVAVGPIP
jgi:hypothetical protein